MTNFISWPHYYGDIVRRLFFAAAVIIFLSLPFLAHQFPVTLLVSLFLVVLIGLFAGLTNPVKPVTIVIDLMVSIIAAFAFEYYAVVTFQANPKIDWIFTIYMALSIIFIVALYFSTKTVRAMFLERRVCKS